MMANTCWYWLMNRSFLSENGHVQLGNHGPPYRQRVPQEEIWWVPLCSFIRQLPSVHNGGQDVFNWFEWQNSPANPWSKRVYSTNPWLVTNYFQSTSQLMTSTTKPVDNGPIHSAPLLPTSGQPLFGAWWLWSHAWERDKSAHSGTRTRSWNLSKGLCGALGIVHHG